MSKPKMPTDANNKPIPVLGFPSGKGAHMLSATDASSRNTTAFDPATKVISIDVEDPIYFRLGDSTVTATTADHRLPVGYHDVAINQDSEITHIAVLRAKSADSEVHISERE